MIYHVYANRQNIGDWLAARAIQAQLSPRPIKQLLIDDYFVAETVATLEAAGEHDLVVIGGGGLLLDYFLPFWEKFEPISKRVPFVVWGAGYCDFKTYNGRPPREFLKSIFARSRLCVLRDELTRSDFPELDLPPATLCPSLMLIEHNPGPKDSVVHGVHYGVTGEELYQRMVQLVNTFADEQKCKYIELNNEIKADDEAALQRQLAFYARARYVVSTRLHGCIIGLASGAKVLAVSGDRKVESFMERVGLQDWVCDLAHLDRLPAMMTALDSQADVAFDAIRKSHSENDEIGRRVRQIADEVAAEEAPA